MNVLRDSFKTNHHAKFIFTGVQMIWITLGIFSKRVNQI